ncbi:zinc-dependent alcohol dehydrogenase family protein [Paenibacillus mendelii]|uniref:Zinc-dependent alcohol dehydrogenase family protein n=1 Tax=Paenibacillus mendelii TaxID=206163 RepID=A0ABV6JFH5_9BACL|nr:zinc-dependent alcohol dehydrogenase family protein [Paenibacillus mendelii]MCQ6557548.1 zinc-dependent alcohol dehydrogenase family protein [Paenibacillus mendelii]
MHPTAIRYHRFGEPTEVLRIESRDLPNLNAGEIRVRMKARSINPSDLIPIRGAYPHRTPLPSIPGYEGVGIIEEAGPAVSQSLLGQRVLPLRGEGTWQDFVTAPAQWAIAVPDSIEDDHACQLYINPITAWILCTDVLGLHAEDVVIVNACGSSIGRIFAQLSSIIGFSLIAITRNDVHTKDLLALGASHVVDGSQTEAKQAILELTNGQRADAAIDCVGGLEGAALLRCVRPGGTLISMGLLSGISVNIAKHALGTGVHVRLFHLRNWMQTVTADRWQETFRRVISLIEREQLKLMTIREHYHFHDAIKAIQAVETRSGVGKIVLTS